MKSTAFSFVVALGTFCCFPGAIAQPKITGKISSADAKPIHNASVLLVKAKDTSLVKGTTSNLSGDFVLDKLNAGEYLLVCSFTGFEDHYTEPFSLTEQPMDMGNISLAATSSKLAGVTVTAKKPMFEQKIDRMVINVKNSITNAGGTVLDVLEKSPGVIVNRSSGTIAMNGKDGVMVMINGKMNYMPIDALVQMLNGMAASSVEKIELIGTPPAKYDAGGNAGYINIVLVDNPNEGFNGNYFLSMGVGKGTFPIAGLNFNYRKKKLNFYGAYGFSREAQLQVFKSYRKVLYKGDVNENSIVSDRDPAQRNHNARLGVDYNIGKKTVLGALVAGYDNKWSMVAKNTSLSYINGKPDTTIIIDNDEINHWKHGMANVNMQHTVREGEQVAVNADYLYYKDNNPTNYQNHYYDGSGAPLFTENTTSGKVTIIKIFVSQLDYSKKINDKLNIEMGVKGSFSKFSNDVLVQKEVQDVWVPDPKFTALYYLKENIGAVYLSADGKLSGKTSIKAGLRYEYTYSNLGSEKQPDIVDRKYGKLFPTFYISHKLNETNTINFSYNRRINRPAFTQLAPFLIFFDPKTFISGNSALQPGIADAVKVDYAIKRFIFSASYTYEKNAIARFQTSVDSTNNTQTQTSQNLDYSQKFFVSASVPVKITSWWSSQINTSLNWNNVKARVNKEAVSVTQYYINISGAESFTLPKNFSIEVSGFFQSKSIIFGANIIKPFGRLDAALQKKFNQGNSSLTFGVDNILNTMIIRTSFDVPEQNFETTGSYQFSQRTFKLSWTQNFGKKTLKDKRSRKTASEEERQRVQ